MQDTPTRAGAPDLATPQAAVDRIAIIARPLTDIGAKPTANVEGLRETLAEYYPGLTVEDIRWALDLALLAQGDARG